MLIEFLIQKELECKQNNQSFSALVLVRNSDFAVAEQFHTRYNALRVAHSNREHRWMDRDTKPVFGHYGVATHNRFKVIIAHTLYLNDYPRTLDMVLIDEYTTWLNQYGTQLQQLQVKQWILATYADITWTPSIYRSFVNQPCVSSNDLVKLMTIEIRYDYATYFPILGLTGSQAREQMKKTIVPKIHTIELR